MQAELISTGAELLNGRTVNTHAQRLGRALGALGLRLVRDTTVADDRTAIAEAVSSALRRAPLVFISGGLGPTCDDVTREALSDALGRRIVTDAATLEGLRVRYEHMGRSLTESRARQAQALEGAVVLANSVGAAPGQRIEIDGRTLFVLPGPPREFEAVLEEGILPWLRLRFPDARPLPERLFLVCGFGESDVIERFEQAGFEAGALELAYCAAPGNLEVRLTGAGPADATLVEEKAAQVREILGEAVFAETRRDLAEVVGEQLRRAGATVATAESCTGGLLGARLTAFAGSSDYYLGGVIAYANEAKIRELGVPEELLARDGAVSEGVACAMAEGVRRRFGATHALSITGTAGPDGGTPEKPVGTVWIGLADAAGARAELHRFVGDRALVRQWSTQMALNMLRLTLG